MMPKNWKNIENLAHGYSSESAQRGRAIQVVPTWQGLEVLQKALRPFAFDESSLSIRKVKIALNEIPKFGSLFA